MHKIRYKRSTRRRLLLLWVIIALLIATIAIVLICSICSSGDGGNGVIIDIPKQTITPTGAVTPEASSTPVVTPELTQGISTSAPTEYVTPVTTPAPTEQGTPVPDYTVFRNCAFVGNSTFEGLYRFGIITEGSFFTKVGLNILSVYEDSTEHGEVPIIDELNTGSYAAVILMFGENELGWPNINVFINKYSQLLNDIWARQPDCDIFITGIPPVSEAKSAQGSESGVNNERIQLYNERLSELADERGCHFITVPGILLNENGALPEEASSDGLHLNLEYSRYWADHICLSVMEGLNY